MISSPTLQAQDDTFPFLCHVRSWPTNCTEQNAWTLCSTPSMWQGKAIQTGKPGCLFSAGDSTWSCKNRNVLKHLHEVLSNHNQQRQHSKCSLSFPAMTKSSLSTQSSKGPYISWGKIWVWPPHWPSITALPSVPKLTSGTEQSLISRWPCVVKPGCSKQPTFTQTLHHKQQNQADSYNQSHCVKMVCLYFPACFCLRHLFITMFILFL